MNGAHDLGGMQGFGPVDRDQPEPFAHPWEEKVFGLTLACGLLGQWNLDQSRFARESMDPGHYLTSSYYEHWLHGLSLLLEERGLVTREELESGSAGGPSPLSAVTADRVAGILQAGGPTSLPMEAEAVFAVGDRVRVRNFHPHSHTRAPRYVRGRCGEIVRGHGAHVFPDEHATSARKLPRHLYNVRFEAAELWGPADGEPRSAVYVDLFEPYLEPVRD